MERFSNVVLSKMQFQPRGKLKTSEIGLSSLSSVSPKKSFPFLFGNTRSLEAAANRGLSAVPALPQVEIIFSPLPSKYSCLLSPSPRANSHLRKEGQRRCSLLVMGSLGCPY